MAKSGWFRENKKDSKGIIRLMDVFYENGKIRTKRLVEEQTIQSYNIKSLYDMILNYLEKDIKFNIYHAKYISPSGLPDESGTIKYLGNSNVDIYINKDSITFYLTGYTKQNFKYLADKNTSECKKELKPIFDYLDKNKVKYNFDYEVF